MPRRVCALVKGDVEKPLDYNGGLYIRLDDSGGWKQKLFQELDAAGFQLNTNRTFQGMNAHIDIPRGEIAAFCKRWQVTELALFGSVLRDDFGPKSDVDVLVRIDPRARHTLLDIVQMQDELSVALGREVDLIERTAIETSPNYIRRKAILQSAQTIYAA